MTLSKLLAHYDLKDSTTELGKPSKYEQFIKRSDVIKYFFYIFL